MRPVRSIWSFFPSVQVTCSVHGARAAADLMRGSMSTVCALFEFIPLLEFQVTRQFVPFLHGGAITLLSRMSKQYVSDKSLIVWRAGQNKTANTYVIEIAI